MSNELKVLFPGKDVTLSTGEVITIKPFTFGQLPRAIKLGQKIGGAVMEASKQGRFGESNGGAAMAIIAEGGEDLIALIGLGINKNREWFDTLQGDDGLTLTIAFLEVNVDFFTQKMLPSLMDAMATFKPATREA